MGQCAVFVYFILFCIIFSTFATAYTGLEEAHSGLHSAIDPYKDREIDIVFVLDKSEANFTKSNWKAQVDFAQALLTNFEITGKKARVAVVVYSTTASSMINNLGSTLGNKCSLFDWLEKNIKFGVNPEGFSNPGAGLETAKTILEISRARSKKFIFVITHSRSNSAIPRVEANKILTDLKWSSWNVSVDPNQVEIFSVTVNSEQAVYSQYSEIAYPPTNHSYWFNSFQSLARVSRTLKQGVDTSWLPVEAAWCGSCSKHSNCTCGVDTGKFVCACGHGYKVQGADCVACPKGTYKDSLALQGCTQCPENSTTSSEAATNISQCECLNKYDGPPGGPCEFKPCSDLPSIPHASKFGVSGEVRTFYTNTGDPCSNNPGDSCHYTCDDGYDIVGSLGLVCLRNGSWDAPPPSCKIRECGSIPITNGNVSYSSGVEYGSIATIQCNIGYRQIGSEMRYCNSDGNWNGTKTSCNVVWCPTLAAPPLVNVTPASCLNQKSPYGTVCTFSCWDGHNQTGPTEKVCQDDTTWTNYLDNITCTDVQAPSITCPPDIVQTLVVGETKKEINWLANLPVATDNSGQAPAVTNDAVFGNPYNFSTGLTTIQFQAKDGADLTSTCNLGVFVNEPQPIVAECNEYKEITATGQTMPINWDNPVFTLINGTNLTSSDEYTCNKVKNSTVSIGNHTVTCYVPGYQHVACSILVEVKTLPCPSISAPTDGTLSCTGPLSNEQLSCSLDCSGIYGFWNPSVTTTYKCDYSGIWSPAFSGFAALSPLQCSRKHLPTDSFVEARVKYGNAADCSEATKQKFISELREKIINESNCNTQNTACNLTGIEYDCQSSGGRKRRSVEDSIDLTHDREKRAVTYTIEVNYTVFTFIVITGTQTPVDPSNMTDDLFANLYDALVNALTLANDATSDTSLINLPSFTTQQVDVPTIQALGNGDFGAVYQLECNDGQTKKDSGLNEYRCVDCPKGHYKLQNANNCAKCAIGFYQNLTAQTNCTMCPENTTTLDTGCDDISQCRSYCEPGSKSDIGTGYTPCSLCPVGTYQPSRNASECIQCPAQHTTAQEGSTQEEDCLAVCFPGTYSSTGYEPCFNCSLHTYQERHEQTSCTPCSDGKETDTEGAINRFYCKDGADQCSGVTCQNGGTCVDLSGNYSCTCTAGYAGGNCENDINECGSSPCLNGGSCTDQIADYSCDCVAGYTGKSCEQDIDDCLGVTCQNSGSCEDRVNGYHCYCTHGYDGSDCQNQVNYCSPTPCLHGRTCTAYVGDYNCDCHPGYADKNCSTVVDFCVANPCNAEGTENNGCTSNNDIGTFNCTCKTGFAGHDCSININDCDPNPCTNGKCIDLVNDFECQCKPGFAGATCSKVLTEDSSICCDRCTVEFTPYWDMGDLTKISTVMTFRTTDEGALLSYHLPNAQYPLIEIGNMKDPEIKMSGYYVRPLDGSGITSLADNYPHTLGFTWSASDGKWAAYVNGTKYGSGTIAANKNITAGGTMLIGATMGGRGSYENLYDGELTQLNMWDNILHEDEIKNISCSSENKKGTAMAWTDVRHHALANEGIKVKNTTCLPDCPDGSELNSSSGVCQKIPYCRSNPCTGSGAKSCYETETGYLCACREGYYGIYCNYEVNPCSDDPNLCGDHGTCNHTGPGSHRCDCETNYSGEKCEIYTIPGPCFPNPCRNGTCWVNGADYMCVCAVGFKGKNCDTEIITNPCESGINPCGNNTCVQAANDKGYNCSCPSQSRQLDPRTCEPLTACQLTKQTCSGHGVCIDPSPDTYECICVDGWIGMHCDTKKDDPTLGPTTDSTPVTSIVTSDSTKPPTTTIGADGSSDAQTTNIIIGVCSSVGALAIIGGVFAACYFLKRGTRSSRICDSTNSSPEPGEVPNKRTSRPESGKTNYSGTYDHIQDAKVVPSVPPTMDLATFNERKKVRKYSDRQLPSRPTSAKKMPYKPKGKQNPYYQGTEEPAPDYLELSPAQKEYENGQAQQTSIYPNLNDMNMNFENEAESASRSNTPKNYNASQAQNRPLSAGSSSHQSISAWGNQPASRNNRPSSANHYQGRSYSPENYGRGNAHFSQQPHGDIPMYNHPPSGNRNRPTSAGSRHDKTLNFTNPHITSHSPREEEYPPHSRSYSAAWEEDRTTREPTRSSVATVSRINPSYSQESIEFENTQEAYKH